MMAVGQNLLHELPSRSLTQDSPAGTRAQRSSSAPEPSGRRAVSFFRRFNPVSRWRRRSEPASRPRFSHEDQVRFFEQLWQEDPSGERAAAYFAVCSGHLTPNTLEYTDSARASPTSSVVSLPLRPSSDPVAGVVTSCRANLLPLPQIPEAFNKDESIHEYRAECSTVKVEPDSGSSRSKPPSRPPPQPPRLDTMSSRLTVPGPIGPNKEKQIQDAKDMYQAVVRNAERVNAEVPPYEFLELIGKGGSGRVYKCRKKDTNRVVAVKIVSIDDVDYSERRCDRDATLTSFKREVAVLQQLKDSNAQNVNMIHDAFDLHSHLWIVSDYCTGGSVRTLMRANPKRGLEENFIVVIVRELVTALKSVHELGVIHRDLKCTNIYVSEEGRIQLGDFGVVGVFDDGASKRKTVIGTPHYMALELHDSAEPGAEGYTFTVDIWALGCTIFEMATGLPPYARDPPELIRRIMVQQPPRLEGDQYSAELRDIVESCCQIDSDLRPTAEELLQHPLIANTRTTYPTNVLIQLIERYKVWELKGGNRTSLWMEGGAAAPPGADDHMDDDDSEDWNFSTSDTFNEDFTRRYSHMVATKDFAGTGDGLTPINTFGLQNLQQYHQAQADRSATRGERSLQRLWDENDEYRFEDDQGHGDELSSDLPFRNFAGSAQTRESLIDLDSVGASDNGPPSIGFDFGDVPTLRARTSRVHETHDDTDEDGYQYAPYESQEKRATMEWTFPASEPSTMRRATMEWQFPASEPKSDRPDTMAWTFPSEPADPASSSPPETDTYSDTANSGFGNGFRPALIHSATEPIGEFGGLQHPSRPFITSSPPERDSITSMIDLDAGLADPNDYVRPRTASSAAGTEVSNQFDLDDDSSQGDGRRISYHKQWQSEGGPVKRSGQRTVPMHSRGNSLTSSDVEVGRLMNDDDNFGFTNTGMLDHYDAEQWASLSSDSGADDDTNFPTLRPRNESLRLQTGSTRSTIISSTNKGEIEFPVPEAPHPDALVEDPDHRVFVGEMDRLFEDMEAGLEAVGFSLQHTLNSDDEAYSSASDMPAIPFNMGHLENHHVVSTDEEDGF